ncbi:MAG TPA: PKD domain-containing protein [Bacteroides sp.]|nr:PKD domain-containing protein [Bacteroides sp.]
MKQTLTLTLLVLFTLGGLAQKPQKDIRIFHQKRLDRHLATERKQAFDDEKASYRANTMEDKQVRQVTYTRPGKLKSAQVGFVEQMDSLIDYAWDEQQMKFYLDYKEWFEYDSLGRNTRNTYQAAESDTTFPDYGGMDEIVWDANDRIVEEIGWNWMDSTGFEKEYWGQYEYDANGNMLIEYSQNWDNIMQSWFPYSTDTSTYDGLNNRIEEVSYYYDTVMKVWDPSYRTAWQFDSVGKRTLKTNYSWIVDSISTWKPNWRYEYFYDQNGRDTTTIDAWWNGASWEKSSKDVTGYNANGARNFHGNYYWDGESQWIGSYKYEYTLDGNDLVTDEIEYSWDNLKNDWYIRSKGTFSRDGTGNILQMAYFRYDTTQMAYIDDWQDNYVWDISVAWADIAMPIGFAEEQEEGEEDNIFTIVSKILGWSYLEYDTTTMAWDTLELEYFYYSPFEGAPLDPIVCNADFSFQPEEGDPQKITFMDESASDASSWYWTFGDGTTSAMQNPMHTYLLPGTYKVSLSTTDATGECSNTLVKQIKVGNTPCTAEFSMTVDTAGQIITLTNLSQGTNLLYSWSFGDGEVSKAMSPRHTYQFAGSYEVTLTVQRDSTCMDRYSMNTRVGTAICRAEFDVFVDSATNTASFSAQNQNPANVYRWEFGDGSIAKTADVTKIFTHPGFYSARLTVSNNTAACVNSQKATILIGSRSPGGQADFIYVSGEGNIVQFSNRSLGESLTYVWDFNDGNTSKEMHPENEFAVPGYYNVCLTVATADGRQNTYCEKIFAGTETTDHCLAQFDYQLSENQLSIACLDRSLGSPDKWNWTYNEAGATTEQNPSWTTSTPAYVKVHQTIMNSSNNCRDDAFALVNMGEDGKLKAGIGYLVDTTNKKADTYPVDFIGVSLGDAGKLKWDFGDGTTDSTSNSPQHVYSTPGVYNVCLTITNTTTGEEDTSCETVTVGGGATSSRNLNAFEVGLKSYPNPFSENTRIEIQLISESDIDLSVYDLMGRKVKSIARENREAGIHTFDFSGSELEAGNYYLILKTENGAARSVMSIVK